MIKKVSLLCVLFASSIICANQKETIDPTDKINNEQQMQMILNAMTKNYNEETLKIYEAKIEQELRNYLFTCVKDISHTKNTQSIEKSSDDLLQCLIQKVKRDEAYSVTSMSFILSWTKVINELAMSIETEQEIENLQEATEEIKTLVEKIFLDPMNEMIEEEEETESCYDNCRCA